MSLEHSPARVGASAHRRKRQRTVDPLAVKPSEAADMLGCGITRIYELMNDGTLVSFKDGASRNVLVSSIHARIAALVNASAKTASTTDAPRPEAG